MIMFSFQDCIHAVAKFLQFVTNIVISNLSSKFCHSKLTIPSVALCKLSSDWTKIGPMRRVVCNLFCSHLVAYI